MIKAVSLHSRNPKLSVPEFAEYWHTVHAPLCSKLMQGLGLRGYVASFPVADSPAFGGVGADFDVLVELHFDDRDALESALSSPQFNTPERQASSAHIFDLKHSRNVICEEVSFPL